MYRLTLRLLAALCLLCTFWPVLRFHDITYFDWLAPVTVLLALGYLPKERGAPFGSYALATSGMALLALAGIISVAPSGDSIQHIMKVIKLTVAISGIIGLAYVLENRKILSITEALFLLCLSATVSSVVCILQGQFGMLTSIMPKDFSHVQSWTRMSGLTEHPIEAGIASCFGVIIALGLGMYTRRWWIFVPLMGLGLYSLTESASLTAVFALVIAFASVALYARAYKALVLGFIVAICGLVLASAVDAHRLTDRLASFSHSGGNYGTVQSREIQWKRALDMIDAGTLLYGNGYSELDLPFNMEIHNGLIASVFHFGLMGLAGQCLLIAFFAVRLRHNVPQKLKSILLGVLLIFCFSYLTGPALSRRSLWVTPFILGAYLTTSDERAPARLKRSTAADRFREKSVLTAANNK
jgi:O-antigen ligase